MIKYRASNGVRFLFINNMEESYFRIFKKAKENWDHIAKPIDSLGVLEDDVAKLCAISESAEPPRLKRRALLVFGADHGVVKEGVTQTDSSVTRIVMENFCNGKACTAIMAERTNCDVYPIDIGMLPDKADSHNINSNAPSNSCGSKSGNYNNDKKVAKNDAAISSDNDIFQNSALLVQHKTNDFNVRPGTGDILIEDAMTPSECIEAISTGMALVKDLKDKGYDIILTGEMGIGNTTPTSVLSALLLDRPAEETTGHGAGLDDKGYERKIEVVNKTISRVRKNNKALNLDFRDFLNDYNVSIDFSTNKFLKYNNKSFKLSDNGFLNDENKSYICQKINSSGKTKQAFYYLFSAGGLEIAAMAGVFLGAEKYKIPAVADGVISLVSALIASEISPSCKDFILASHFPKEKSGQIIISVLDIAPAIDAKLALGEGSGAVCLLPLLDMAIDVYQKMGTFEDFDIDSYKRFEEV